jgi:hypothetical protein
MVLLCPLAAVSLRRPAAVAARVPLDDEKVLLGAELVLLGAEVVPLHAELLRFSPLLMPMFFWWPGAAEVSPSATWQPLAADGGRWWSGPQVLLVPDVLLVAEGGRVPKCFWWPLAARVLLVAEGARVPKCFWWPTAAEVPPSAS